MTSNSIDLIQMRLDYSTDQRVWDLITEVERLRHELDQRTDPELADELAAWAMSDPDLLEVDERRLKAAARLLGGDQ